MRQFLADRLYRKHYQKLVKSKISSEKKLINTISSVTILASMKHHTIDQLLEAQLYFQKLDVAIDIYALQEDNEVIDPPQDISLIYKNECLWYGIPSQEVLIQWLSNKTDLLILTNPDDLPLMKYLCAASNCKLKATLQDPSRDMKDLDIDLWIDVREKKLSLVEQCRRTYSTLVNLGLGSTVS